MNFQIQEKNHELTEGYFMLIMKYSVLFLVAWMFAILIIYTYPCLAWDTNKYPPFIRFLNDYNILSWIFVAGLFSWYSNKKINQYKLGFLTKLRFNKLSNIFEFTLIHPLNGKSYETNVDANNLKVVKTHKHSQWTGDKVTYEFYDNDQLITRLTPSRSAWKFNSDYLNFIEYLDSLIVSM
jgi:hypothetical protein